MKAGKAIEIRGSQTFLTTAEVCALAGVTRAAVHNWCRAGKLDAARIGKKMGSGDGGEMRLFLRPQVLQFLAARNAKRGQANRRRQKKSSS